LKKRPLRYRYKPDHRVSLPVYLRLQLRGLANAIAEVAIAPMPHSETFAFVAGCGHSGTTLVASKLGLHPQVLLISRESNIFLPSHGLRLARVILQEWLAFARQDHRTLIVEKSPKHIQAVRRLRRLLPGARIVAVARNPLDTCASLHRRFGDIDYAIERWLMDSEATLEALQEPSTLLVRYEDLTRDPAATLATVCSFLGLPWNAEILTRGGSAYGTHHELRPNMAVRNEQVSQPIHDNSGKWRAVLDARQAAQVREKTAALATRLGYALEPG
jgi:hypothetical protein